MKHFSFLIFLLMSVISAEAQGVDAGSTQKNNRVSTRDLVERPRFFDNWSISLAGGIYHPMIFDLKYLADCSGWAGDVELRKQLTPVVGIGIEADGYYRMNRKERQDPRTLVGLMFHANLMNLFGGYRGRPRLFEMELGVMPAWGHLYRGSTQEVFPDEDYFSTKYMLDFRFNLGHTRAWTLNLQPAMVCDVTSYAPVPGRITRYREGYTLDKSDLQLFLGVSYHFRSHDGGRHFRYAEPQVDQDEITRLNEIVRFLRRDVEERDQQLRDLRREIDELKR